jgi:hypothetical protein
MLRTRLFKTREARDLEAERLRADGFTPRTYVSEHGFHVWWQDSKATRTAPKGGRATARKPQPAGGRT